MLITLSSAATGQVLIRGILADSSTFNPLEGVTVRVKHQRTGTVSDQQGNFSLTATQQDTLIFSRVGYKTLEFSLFQYEPSLILMTEDVTYLDAVTVEDSAEYNPYAGMFDEQNSKLTSLRKSIPFYYVKARKDKIMRQRLKNENLRVKTYVDVVINSPATKADLMKRHELTEDEYYDLLAKFNEQNYAVMYYLTGVELISLLNNFYARHAR
jgi:hypothetical protein